MNMSTISFDQKNAIIDENIASRRSQRFFLEEEPSEEDVSHIIHAGLLAPYAAVAVGESKDYFRRFFVIQKGSLAMKTAAPLVMEKMEANIAKLEHIAENDAHFRDQAIGFIRRMKMFQNKGIIPGIGTAPYYIVIAERRGFPPVEFQSLGHCLENMWLKATALGLGFQIVAITADIADNPDFCKLLGISAGEWALMGCAVGYPQKELPPAIRPPAEDVTRWLD